MRVARVARAIVPLLVGAATAPDATLYTTYTFSSTHQSISWLTCGSTAGSGGCYASGNLTDFQNACAMLSSQERVSGNSTTQDIYVFKNRSSPRGGNSLVLDEYPKTDTVTSRYTTTTFTLQHSAPPQVAAGTGSRLVAANSSHIVAALSSHAAAAEIAKKDLSQQGIGGLSSPETVVSISPDSRGYVSVNFTGGFYLYGPTGGLAEDGGDDAFLVNEQTGLTPQ